MLVARVLRSPHAHARIARIDATKAEALAGVRAVITYRDAPKVMIWGHRQYALNERARFVGEAVAAVAAVDADTAEQAVKLIDVQYEPLPFVLDPEEALKPGAPQLFEDGNLEGPPRILTRGDVEQGLKESDKVIERVYHCPTMWSGGMEPRASVAQWEGDRLTLWASTQSPFRVHGSLAAMFNVPDSNVRIIASYIGGGFGTKSAPHTDEALAALLARKARLPVKLQYSREEEILDSNTRFETRMYVRIGVKSDMSLHALDVKAYINQGAYHTRLGGLGNQATHLYRTPHVRTEQLRVHTNVPNTGPTRGVGDPQETFGIESAIDEIAIEMGWDPMAFRLKNIKRTGDPIARGGAGTEDGRLVTQVLDRCIEDGAARIQWARRNAVAGSPRGSEGARHRHRVHGAGRRRRAGRRVRQGQPGRLGDGVLFLHRYRHRKPHHARDDCRGDAGHAARHVPVGVGRYGNRAVRRRQPGESHAAGHRSRGRSGGAGVPETDPRVSGAAARQCGTRRPRDGRRRHPRQGAAGAHASSSRTSCSAAAVVSWGSGTQSCRRPAIEVERTSAAHFVEVEVDRETGKVRILRYVAAHDVGRPVNVTIVENQIEGGTIQGLALTQGEEMRFDSRTGACLTASFVDLKPPTMLDFDPRLIEAVIVPNEGSVGPYGAKGLGENPCHPGMAAVANAIYNAIGVRLREVPFTRGVILRALSAQRPATAQPPDWQRTRWIISVTAGRPR